MGLVDAGHRLGVHPIESFERVVAPRIVTDVKDLGARFEGRNDRGDTGTWQTVCTVTAWSPGEAFEWTVGDIDAPTAIWRFDIAETPNGSRLTMTARLGAGRSFLRAIVRRYPEQGERLVERRMDEWRANMRATVEGVRALLEQAGP